MRNGRGFQESAAHRPSWGVCYMSPAGLDEFPSALSFIQLHPDTSASVYEAHGTSQSLGQLSVTSAGAPISLESGWRAS